VRAALELFTSKGYHETTTPLIAGRAGIAEGTIYRHFASKDELFNEIYRAGIRLFLGVVREADARERCGERLRPVAQRWRDLALREPALLRLVFSDLAAQLVDEKSRVVARDLHTELEKVVAAGKAAGEVRPGAAELWAEMWLRCVLLALERVARGAAGIRRGVGRDPGRAGAAATAGLGGLAAAPATSPPCSRGMPGCLATPERLQPAARGCAGTRVPHPDTRWRCTACRPPAWRARRRARTR
jgi:AcrR family transcriptional regulator